MQREWIWLAPGKDGHYPNGAWFFQDTEATQSPHSKFSFRHTQGTIVESTIAARKGQFYVQLHGANRRPDTYTTNLEAAKKLVEAWAIEKDHKVATSTVNGLDKPTA